jgi:hypothetical protein
MRRVVARFAAIVLTLLALGTIPGAVQRPVLFERTVEVLPKAPDQDLELTVRTWSQPGRTPLAHARVRVLAIVDDRAYLAGAGETDGGGEITLRGLPRAAAWILAEADGHARASTQRILTSAEPPVDLDLPPGHTLGVALTDDLGQAVAGAEVEVGGGDPLPVGARADVDGLATVTRLGEGPWTVTVRADGFEPVVRREVPEGKPLHVVLQKLGALLVRVVRDADTPAPLARVQVAGSSLWPARTTDTGADGTVRIAGLLSGSYALRATAGALVSETDLGIALARGEERTITLRLGPGIFASARVMDGEAEDAMPVPQARVTLVETGLSPFPLEALSDKDGFVRLGPVVAAPAVLTAQADGFVPLAGVLVPLDGHPVTLVMVKAGTVVGRVVDGKGRPVGGASISVVGTSFSGSPIEDDPRTQTFRRAQFDSNLVGPRALVPSGELGVVPGPVPKIPALVDLAPTTVGAGPVGGLEAWVTKDDGTFRASPVSPGRVRVVVRHPEFLEGLSDVVTLAPDGEAHVDVVLREGGSLEGRVVDASGRPMGNATVSIAALRGSTERSTRSASDGTFAFAALPEGVVVTAYPEDEEEGARVARTTVTVPEGGTAHVSLTIADARPTLEVRVRDDRGYPLGAAQISAGSVDPSIPLRTTVFTDATGMAGLPGARGVAVRLTVSAPGYVTRAVEVPAAESSPEVTLEPAQVVTGSVREARGGGGIKMAEVTLYAPDGVHRGVTDGDGRFKLRDVGAGEARLRVRAPERVTREQAVTIDAGSHGIDVGNVELAEEAILAGTVVDGRGDPVPGARVGKDHVLTYVPLRGRDPEVAVTDGRGRFRLGGLDEGTVVIEAYAPDLGRARVEGVRVTAGRTATGVVLRLAPEDAGKAVEPATSGGVAVTLGEVGGEVVVVVVGVAEGSEAERAGLMPGDAILEVDGVPVGSISDARSRLSGPVGEDVVVVRRRGDRTESLRVPREPVRR